ncbi:3',5'-cyclic-nucleotide phosphodiesterase [Thalassotalea sp. M1531]|uniref:3',5'-cyclic-nucleotide phosphodiesterase n=1 Tax=Thalassotalea algicola TaxID=2716224 RepID=A0A7Y0LDM8_9GAMM|nr:metallophosphoesterase [Thalassotalea algicola]NMP32264.1 3',5'-cyclic-nucleotide phosphodiesterase [Thalassotalea algicola]
MLNSVNIAQFSDSHLFSDTKAKHHGAPVFENLSKVCKHIAGDKTIDIAIFTGDLTQDHTEDSYQVFADAVKKHLSHIPVYYLAGNHDEIDLLNKYLVNQPFRQQNLINLQMWQFHLINSKSDTPAGFVSNTQLAEVAKSSEPERFQFYFMHHHPQNVDYFIDRHGLENKKHFWQWLETQENVKGIACGHVHRAMKFTYQTNGFLLPVYTCPATSIQFAKHPKELKAEAISPAYRKFCFQGNGQITTELFYL